MVINSTVSDGEQGDNYAERFAALIGRIATMTLSDAALECARAGVPIFPCKPGTKEPACHNGWLDATCNEAMIAEWWRGDPYNIGFPPGRIGMAVLDLDTYKPDYIPPEHLPPTLVTGCRGEHHHYVGATHDGKLPGCIDIKSAGGYVLLPPSVFVNEGQSHPYRLIHDRPLATTPGWVLDRPKHEDAEEPPEGLVEDDTDQALLDEGAARAKRYVARFGVVGAEPRGNRAFALGGLLYGMRHGLSILSVGKIVELMREAGFAAVEDDIFGRLNNPRGWEAIGVRLTLDDLEEMAAKTKVGDDINPLLAAVVAANLNIANSETIRRIICLDRKLLRTTRYDTEVKRLEAKARRSVTRSVTAQKEPAMKIGRFNIIQTDPSEPGILEVPIGPDGTKVEFRDMGEVRVERRFWDRVELKIGFGLVRPEPMGDELWNSVVIDRHLKDASMLMLNPEEMYLGMVWRHLREWCQYKAKARALDEVLLGRSYHHKGPEQEVRRDGRQLEDGGIYFEPSAFFEFCFSKRMPNKVIDRLPSYLRQLGVAQESGWTIKGKEGVVLYRMSTALPKEQSEEFAVPKVEEEGPF